MSSDILFLRMIDEFCTDSVTAATRKLVDTDPIYQNKATVAEEFSAGLCNQFYKMLSFGVLLRMHEKELADMKASGEKNDEKFEALESGRKNAEKLFYDLANYLEENIHYQVVPLKNLISIQLTSGFLSMEYVKEHK